MLPCISSTIFKINVRHLIFHQRAKIHLTINNEAARKGTREKARKNKVKVEVQKVGFIPHNQRGKDKLSALKTEKHIDDSWKAIAHDNVYVGKYYRWRVYTIEEAIECHRETHHPSMYNVPDAPLNVEIELNMQGEKVTRFVENFQRMAMIPHRFDHGEERKLIVFAKGQEFLNEAAESGATLCGGPELIKDIQNGDLNLQEYQYYLAHPNILADLVGVRGLMKRKFPNPKSGTLGTNLGEMIRKYKDGVQYQSIKDENQKNFGIIKTAVGTLTMDTQHLKENIISLLKDVDVARPKRDGKFITRVLLKSPPSSEQLKIDPFLYVAENFKASGRDSKSATETNENEEVDEDDEKQAITN